MTDDHHENSAGSSEVSSAVRRFDRRVAAGLAVLLLSGVLVLVLTRTPAEVDADEALPVSDDFPADLELAIVPPASAPDDPLPQPEPLFEAPDQPMVGRLVATAKITNGEVGVWAAQSDDEPAWILPVPTEFGGDRHFLVIEEADDWLKIQVPVRPNETVGWIPRDDVTLSATDYRVRVDVSDRAVTVWRGDEVVLDTTSAVGRNSAPTPLGGYYIRDVLPWDPESVYGPYVIALSAYSESIDQINGGDAVVALHGTSRPDLLGQAVSLGCIRLENGDITLIAQTVPVGTPVEIVG